MEGLTHSRLAFVVVGGTLLSEVVMQIKAHTEASEEAQLLRK